MPTRARLLITLAWPTLALHGLRPGPRRCSTSRGPRTTPPRLLALSWIQEAVVHVSCQDWRAALAALDQVGDGHGLLDPARAGRRPHQRRAGPPVAARARPGPRRPDGRPRPSASSTASRSRSSRPATTWAASSTTRVGCPRRSELMREADEMDGAGGPGPGPARPRAWSCSRSGCSTRPARPSPAPSTRPGATATGSRRPTSGSTSRRPRCCATTWRPRATTSTPPWRPSAPAGPASAGAAPRCCGRPSRLAEGVVPRGLDRTLAPWLDVDRPVTPDERLAARVHVEALLLRGRSPSAGYAVQRLRGRVRQGFAADMHDRLLVAKVAAAQGDTPRSRRAVRAAMHRLTERQAPSQSLEIRSALALHGRRLADFDVNDALASGSAAPGLRRGRALARGVAPAAAAVRARRTSGRRSWWPSCARPAARRVAPGRGGRAPARPGGTRSSGRSAASTGRAPSRTASARRCAPVGHAHRRASCSGPAASRRWCGWPRRARSTSWSSPRGAARLHHLGSAAEVAALADRLTRDLRAHAFAGTNPALEAAVGRAVAGSVAALDQRAVRRPRTWPTGRSWSSRAAP